MESLYIGLRGLILANRFILYDMIIMPWLCVAICICSGGLELGLENCSLQYAFVHTAKRKLLLPFLSWKTAIGSGLGAVSVARLYCAAMSDSRILTRCKCTCKHSPEPRPYPYADAHSHIQTNNISGVQNESSSYAAF